MRRVAGTPSLPTSQPGPQIASGTPLSLNRCLTALCPGPDGLHVKRTLRAIISVGIDARSGSKHQQITCKRRPQRQFLNPDPGKRLAFVQAELVQPVEI